MIALSLTGVSLSFGTAVILDRVGFSLDERDKLGVIGVNGCGKSSLFRIIAGAAHDGGGYEPTSGEVFFAKGKSIGYLAQDGAFTEIGKESADACACDYMLSAFPRLTEAEKKLEELQAILDRGEQDPAYGQAARIYPGLHDDFVRDGGLEYRSRCVGILRSLGFDDALSKLPLRQLSGGQKTRLALGIQLAKRPDILLLDEPTNHLDIDTLSWLEGYLRDYPGCVLIVSHDRYFLDRVTNKTLCIQNHRATLYNGNYTESMEKRRIDREIAEKHYKDQQKEIARQEAYIAQQRAWNRERNIIAAESRQKMLNKMVRLEKPENAPKPIHLRFTASRESGNDVLELRDVGMRFDRHVLFEHLNLTVKKNERVCVLGKNGCGKSTLIKMLIGRLEPASGVIEAGYNVEIGYYDQENQQLSPDKTVLDELWDAYPQMTETQIRTALGGFRFVGENVYKTVAVLSGGERARLTLCKLILSKMNLLILDEPTNHLDIDSREALETALSAFDGTVLTVSHDRYFIEKLATRIIEIDRGNGLPEGSDYTDYHVDRAGGAYTEYRSFADSRLQGRKNAPTGMSGTDVADGRSAAGKAGYLAAKQTAAEERKRRHRLEKLTLEAETLEKEIDDIVAEMNGQAASDYLRVAELDALKTQKEERLMQVYEESELLNG